MLPIPSVTQLLPGFKTAPFSVITHLPGILYLVEEQHFVLLYCIIVIGGDNSNPLQYPCLENPMNREAWQTEGHKELDKTQQLSILLSQCFFFFFFLVMLKLFSKNLKFILLKEVFS